MAALQCPQCQQALGFWTFLKAPHPWALRCAQCSAGLRLAHAWLFLLPGMALAAAFVIYAIASSLPLLHFLVGGVVLAAVLEGGIYAIARLLDVGLQVRESGREAGGGPPVGRSRVRMILRLSSVLLGIGLIVLLYPFQRRMFAVFVRVEGQLVSRQTGRPLPGVCVDFDQWPTAERAAEKCSRLRAGKYHAAYKVPEGEGAIFISVGVTDAEGRFRVHALAHWPLSKNLLGMRFRRGASHFRFRNVPFFLLREGAEPVQVPVPDGEWRELAPGAEVLLRKKEGYVVFRDGTGETRRVPNEEFSDVSVLGVMNLGSIPVTIDE